MPNNRPPRRCTECGEPQQITTTTTDYPESGLDNVQLINVPMWTCPNGHEELQIPGADELHALLATMVMCKPSRLTGAEIRFLRKELRMNARFFAGLLGMSAVHLSRIETGARPVTPVMNSHVRLAIAWELAKAKALPMDQLDPFVSALEALDVGGHRLQHLDNAPPDQQWEPVADDERRHPKTAPP